MISEAGKLSWARAAGIYLAQDALTMVVVASTPHGVQTVSTVTQPVLPDQTPEATLKELLESTLSPGQRKRMPICLGIEPERTFFSTTPTPAHSEDVTVEDVLSACGAGDVSQNNSVVDFVQHRVKTTEICSVAACPRDAAQEICQTLQDAGADNARFEPAAWALAKTPPAKQEFPRGWKHILRIIANDQGGIAILMSDSHPAIWRRFGGLSIRNAKALTSTIRLIEIHARERLGIDRINGITVQGIALELREELETLLDIPIKDIPGDPLSPELYAHSLAMSAKKPGDKPMDLFRPLLPPPSLMKMVPVKLAAMVLIGLAGMGLALWDECGSLKRDIQMLKMQNAQHAWATGLTTMKINKQCEELQAEVDCVETFLKTRVLWTNYLRDLPTRLPPNAGITDLYGFGEMPELGKRKHTRAINKSISIKGITRFTHREIAPMEVDAFLESLRNVELLKEEFPLVTLAEIQWRKEADDEVALFSVVALPKKD